jgi:hypothetical protein
MRTPGTFGTFGRAREVQDVESAPYALRVIT